MRQARQGEQVQPIMRQRHPMSLERMEWEKVKNRFPKYSSGKQQWDARGVTSTLCFFSPTVFRAGSGDKGFFFQCFLVFP